MAISKFQPLPKEIFETLANKHDLHSVSIYLPMHKTGKEQNEGLDQANLKHCIKEVHKALANRQMNALEITNYLKPIEDLIATIELWRNPSDGLAIFLDRSGLNQYTLPVSFKMKTEVSDHFYLQPLLSLYQEDGDYYLLELSQDYVKLYEASRYGFKDIYIEDFAPDQLEKAVGFDYEQNISQVRSGQHLKSVSSFYGIGGNEDDKKKEIITFFRAIDKGINKKIKNKKAPLILACVDSLFSLYKETNSYPTLFNKNWSGDTEFKDKNELHKDSWKLIKPFFQITKKNKLLKFAELYNTSKTSYEISDIIPAALNGKIDTLFVQDGFELYGLYNAENEHVRIDEKKEISNSSLTNLASIKTFMQNGRVFILKPNEMPVKESPLNALFRY